MATNSFLKEIHIKEKNMGRTLVEALEKSNKKGTKASKGSLQCRTITGNNIKRYFGE